MLRKSSVLRVMYATGRTGPVASAVLLSALMAGCSADVGRFDLSSGVGSRDRTSTASLPTPSEPLRRNAGIPVDNDTYANASDQRGYDRTPAGGTFDRGATPPRDQPIRMAGLPEPAFREPVGRPAPAQPRVAAAPVAAGRQIPAAASQPAAPRAAAGPGETIEVQPGDTLYGLSKRYRISISELMSLNSLATPAIKPGQKLTLPAGKRPLATRPVAQNAVAQPTDAPAATPAAATPAAAAPARLARPAPIAAAPVAPVAAPTDWSGSYTVASGDSLFAIARKHKVKAGDLQAANGITDPTKVRPGTVLKVPGDGTTPAPAAAAPIVAAPVAPPRAQNVAQAAGKSPTIINASPVAASPVPETKVAALGNQSANDASPAKAEPALPDTPKTSSATKFRWPVKGKVIASFGPRADNTHNDGINISVPQGTEVLAAENGVVAYAGSELKGYGNLILVRHDGNWVSAYAHNDQILVKRGDKVKRGQSLAKAGTTGTVDQPQVHFELRQGSKPVDPLPHMEKN